MSEQNEKPAPPSEAATSVAAAATASSSNEENTKDDATIAAWWNAMEQLTSVFGFSQEVAQQAVEAVGVDVTQAYNYILDNNLAADKGGPVVPIQDCPHVKEHVRLLPHQLPHPKSATCHYNAEQKDSKDQKGQAKSEILQDGTCPPGENWLCLQCAAVGCSRYVNAHGVVHYEESVKEDGGEDGAGHCIAASLADLSVWCHACQAYLRHPDLDPLIKKLEQLKFDSDEDSEAETNNEQVIFENEQVAITADVEKLRDTKSSDNEEVDSMSTQHDEETENVGRGIPFIFDGLVEAEAPPITYPFGSLPTDLKGVADFIQSENCKSIVVLAGAGMSVVSGIPDFRSHGGLYDTLDPSLLTASDVEREAMRADPTAALEQGMFIQNPLPCLELMRPFILGTRDQQWKATLAHRFVELLHSKTGKLKRLYTQNIDGLEGQCTKLPRDKVVAVHGSMDQCHCAICGTTSDFNRFCDQVQSNIKDITQADPTAPKESTPVRCQVCNFAAVKPTIVLFRSPLPQEFFQRAPEDILEVDLLIVIGTSLAVAPVNTLVYRVPQTALRVVVNREPVGYRLGMMYGQDAKRDYFAQGDCDRGLLDLMTHLGWLEDLAPLMDSLPQASSDMLKDRLAEVTGTSNSETK